jgi:beta-glucanase (GH16 family)
MQREESRGTRARCAARRTALTRNVNAGRAAKRTPAVLVLLAAAALGPQAQAEPPPDRQWKLVFSDEFEGQTIDPSKWGTSRHFGWALNGIKTERTPTNSFLDGQGHFVNVLSRDEAGVLRYHHGIDTKGKFHFVYGYAEARVQFSREPGWWSAFWLWGVEKGVNPFLYGQEIDIYEDFFKPKRRNDIQHAVHFDTELDVAEESARNVGAAQMIHAARMGRVSKGCLGGGAQLADYGGWHTVAVLWTPLEYIWYVDGKETARLDYKKVPVTTQPQYVLLSGIFRAPAAKDDPKKLFYGDIREAKLPDQFMVDYVRVYQEEPGSRKSPTVTLRRQDGTGDVRPDGSASFEATASEAGGKSATILLFSNGRLRAETAKASDVFTLAGDRFFSGENVLIAMARTADGAVGISEPLTVRVRGAQEGKGKPYLGKPQVIPGKIIPGHYDEGGQGVAYSSFFGANTFGKAPWNKDFRATEGINAPDANGIAAGHTGLWVSYSVRVQQTGDYKVAPSICRQDIHASHLDSKSLIALELDDKPLAEFAFSSRLATGPLYWANYKELPAQTVRLIEGEHVLRVRFDVRSPFNFGGLSFAPVAEAPRAAEHE